MQQQIAVVTIGIDDLARSRRFYTEGFGWVPCFENAEVIFYQMNGFVFGTWLRSALAADTQRSASFEVGSYAMSHNVPTRDEVGATINRLIAFGGRSLRPADAPEHGGYRGYVADPDQHAWEIAWNPSWKIDAAGHVTFGV